MNENIVKKYSIIEMGAWVIIAVLVTYCAMSIKYTKQIMASQGDFSTSYASSGSGEYQFKKLKKVLSVLNKEYLFDYDMETLEEGAISGMLDALDEPYTSYFNQNDTEEFLTETEGEYEGVGIYITLDTEKDLGMVLATIKGSPAAEAGIEGGDYILAIDDVEVSGTALEALSSKIKGLSGTKVKIKFARYNKETKVYDEFEKTFTRRSIDLNPFEYEVLEDNIGYISFASFDEKAPDRFKAAYKDLVENKKVDGLIIDLRNNPGGLITTAQSITDMLVPTGIITYTVDKNGNKDVLYSDSNSCSVPLVVIVNENSARASEIMASAIKDSGVGKIVGKTSYGKGLVQKFKSLGDGTYIKVTISEYFSPNGNKINKIGVVPDYEVEDEDDTKTDEQLEKALEVVKEM